MTPVEKYIEISFSRERHGSEYFKLHKYIHIFHTINDIYRQYSEFYIKMAQKVLAL